MTEEETVKLRSISLALALVLVLLLAAACGTAATPDASPGTAAETEQTQPEAETQPTEPESAPEPEPEPEQMSTLDRVLEEGVVRVGFANENPYAYQEADGTLTGEAVEVARAVLTNLGIEEMEGVLTEFGSLIPGLQAGRFDIITAGMYVNPTRCEQILFADPEYKIGEALIVQAGNPLGLNSFEDIAANADVRVGTGAGYLSIDLMKAVGVLEDQIVTFPDDPSGMAGLQAGQIDVWTGTRPTLLKMLEVADDANFELADPFTAPIIDGAPAVNYGAAGFRTEDLDFRQAFNEELQKLKDSGELLEIIGQFEGFDEGALPGDTSAEDICPDAYAGIE